MPQVQQQIALRGLEVDSIGDHGKPLFARQVPKGRLPRLRILLADSTFSGCPLADITFTDTVFAGSCLRVPLCIPQRAM